MEKRKIAVVTGSRAEYGLLYWVLQEIKKTPEFELQLIATCMHLSPEFGSTYKEIEKDGFNIDAKVEMSLSDDSPIGISKSISMGTTGFAEAYERLKPDIIMMFGDRFELIAAAQAALIFQIPIAHISGGDTTEGAIDEAIRHSITKMSHLHFVTNKDAEKRVKQLGENPKHVFCVGDPGLLHIDHLEKMPKEQLEASLNFKFRKKNLLITYHPATLDSACSEEHINEFLKALDFFEEDVGLIFTGVNADPTGSVIKRKILEFVKNHSNATYHVSLGQKRYLNTMSYVDVVAGNSSSGLLEAPSLEKPTVNIGDRQKGRLRASSVIDCDPSSDDIFEAIQVAFKLDCSEVINPYYFGNSAKKIVKILKDFPHYNNLIKKHFFDYEVK